MYLESIIFVDYARKTEVFSLQKDIYITCYNTAEASKGVKVMYIGPYYIHPRYHRYKGHRELEIRFMYGINHAKEIKLILELDLVNGTVWWTDQRHAEETGFRFKFMIHRDYFKFRETMKRS